MREIRTSGLTVGREGATLPGYPTCLATPSARPRVVRPAVNGPGYMGEGP